MPQGRTASASLLLLDEIRLPGLGRPERYGSDGSSQSSDSEEGSEGAEQSCHVVLAGAGFCQAEARDIRLAAQMLFMNDGVASKGTSAASESKTGLHRGATMISPQSPAIRI